MAMTFDGTNHIEMPGWTGQDLPLDVSVCMWVNRSETGVVHRLLGYHDLWEVRISGDTMTNDIRQGTSHNASTTINAGQWYFMVFTNNGTSGDIGMYLDGVLDGSGTGNTIAPALTTLSVGTRTGSTERFKGSMDDVRIYNRVLSVGEIETMYAAKGTDGVVDGLVNRWIFTEASPGTTATVAGSIKGIGPNTLNGNPISSPVYAESRLKFRRRG